MMDDKRIVDLPSSTDVEAGVHPVASHSIRSRPPLYGAHYVKRYLLCADAVCWTGMGIGLAAVWTALGRSTLDPVGPESGA